MILDDKNISDTFEKFDTLYAWSASILIMQLLTLTWVTGRIRVRTQTIHSEEDRIWMKNEKITLCVKGGGHPEVDRIRSAHFNDLTLIMIWLFITPFWLLTAPDYTTAFFVMKLFMISKIVNTILYITSNVIQLSIIPRLTNFICYSLIIFLAVNLIFYYY